MLVYLTFRVSYPHSDCLKLLFYVITLHGYFDKVPYIEGILNCQVSEIDQSIDKLKEFGRVIKESLDN